MMCDHRHMDNKRQAIDAVAQASGDRSGEAKPSNGPFNTYNFVFGKLSLKLDSASMNVSKRLHKIDSSRESVPTSQLQVKQGPAPCLS
jgi:hypothetical protein